MWAAQKKDKITLTNNKPHNFFAWLLLLVRLQHKCLVCWCQFPLPASDIHTSTLISIPFYLCLSFYISLFLSLANLPINFACIFDALNSFHFLIGRLFFSLWKFLLLQIIEFVSTANCKAYNIFFKLIFKLFIKTINPRGQAFFIQCKQIWMIVLLFFLLPSSPLSPVYFPSSSGWLTLL